MGELEVDTRSSAFILLKTPQHRLDRLVRHTNTVFCGLCPRGYSVDGSRYIPFGALATYGLGHIRGVGKQESNREKGHRTFSPPTGITFRNPCLSQWRDKLKKFCGGWFLQAGNGFPGRETIFAVDTPFPSRQTVFPAGNCCNSSHRVFARFDALDFRMLATAIQDLVVLQSRVPLESGVIFLLAVMQGGEWPLRNIRTCFISSN
jgi:hypothetical protein